MANDSSTGGVLTPEASPAPLYGQALDRFIQQTFAPIVGLAGPMMRPRWQKEPPNMPPNNQNWAAVGVTNFKGDVFAAVVHNPSGQGSDTVFRQEELTVLASFYGPDAANYAALLREGLSVPQNREVLTANNMGLIEVSDITPVPSLLNERWQYRVDVTVGLRRAVLRTYPILNILSAEGSIVTDNDPPLTEPINVTS